ncbi:hypothetical protein ACFCY8_39595 [Streptomyces noursei]|uniref:hypothetical protein n=1 Tax=Streptomyces noursei TaxID=1971 RepID=UPI003400D570
MKGFRLQQLANGASLVLEVLDALHPHAEQLAEAIECPLGADVQVIPSSPWDRVRG